jgi:hypothetical protein
MRCRDIVHAGHAAVEMFHGEARLVIVHDVGPRIAWYGKRDGRNLLYWDEAGTRARGAWTLRGGHRLWVTRPLADEAEETYAPDGRPCVVRHVRDGVRVEAPVDAARLAKALVVRARPGGGFDVEHRVRNASDMLWSGGAWALTCTRPTRRTSYGVPLGGGPRGWDAFAMVFPLRWGGGHTSRADDPQLRIHQHCLVVRPRGDEAKRMVQAPRGLVGMTDHAAGLTFIKRAEYDASQGERYPLHCNVAVYLGPAAFMVELETMSPVRTLVPGESLRHVERWSLHDPVDWARWRPDGPSVG